jgi:hypothetical protein
MFIVMWITTDFGLLEDMTEVKNRFCNRENLGFLDSRANCEDSYLHTKNLKPEYVTYIERSTIE